MAASVHWRVVGRCGLGSPATQLMRAVSWHDKAGVSSPVWRPAHFEASSRLGPPFGWVRRRVGLDQVRLARPESVGTRCQLTNGLSAVVVGEQSCPMAGRALAKGNVAGPHAVERQVAVGVRAGGLLEVHAAGWLVLAESRQAETRRTKCCSNSPRPSWSVSTVESVGGGRRMFGSRRLGPLFAVVAPLGACERVSVGAATALSAWPPALREWWHTCCRCGGSLEACRQLTNACS
jgi:hypothetical protein